MFSLVQGAIDSWYLVLLSRGVPDGWGYILKFQILLELLLLLLSNYYWGWENNLRHDDWKAVIPRKLFSILEGFWSYEIYEAGCRLSGYCTIIADGAVNPNHQHNMGTTTVVAEFEGVASYPIRPTIVRTAAVILWWGLREFSMVIRRQHPHFSHLRLTNSLSN